MQQRLQKVVIGGELDLIKLQKYFDRPERGQFTRSDGRLLLRSGAAGRA